MPLIAAQAFVVKRFSAAGCGRNRRFDKPDFFR
jgi:hypothetical protein